MLQGQVAGGAWRVAGGVIDRVSDRVRMLVHARSAFGTGGPGGPETACRRQPCEDRGRDQGNAAIFAALDASLGWQGGFACLAEAKCRRNETAVAWGLPEGRRPWAEADHPCLSAFWVQSKAVQSTALQGGLRPRRFGAKRLWNRRSGRAGDSLPEAALRRSRARSRQCGDFRRFWASGKSRRGRPSGTSGDAGFVVWSPAFRRNLRSHRILVFMGAGMGGITITVNLRLFPLSLPLSPFPRFPHLRRRSRGLGLRWSRGILPAGLGWGGPAGRLRLRRSRWRRCSRRPS
jgi:hypothetical protein